MSGGKETVETAVWLHDATVPHLAIIFSAPANLSRWQDGDEEEDRPLADIAGADGSICGIGSGPSTDAITRRLDRQPRSKRRRRGQMAGFGGP